MISRIHKKLIQERWANNPKFGSPTHHLKVKCARARFFDWNRVRNLFRPVSPLFKFWDVLFCMLTSNVEVFELLINPPSFPFVSSYSSRYKQNTFPFFARFGQSIHRAFQWFIFLANYLKFLLNSYSVAPGLVSTLKYETLFGRIVTIKLVFVII